MGSNVGANIAGAHRIQRIRSVLKTQLNAKDFIETPSFPSDFFLATRDINEGNFSHKTAHTQG